MFESIFPFKKLGSKIKSPKKKKKAMDFVTGGQAPGASIVSGARNNIVSFQRNNVSAPSQNNLGSVVNNISNTQTYGRATGYDILDFFGSKKTERRLRKSVQRLRNSLAETFEIAKFLRITINRIAKQLKDIPSISGGGGGGGALGLIAGLIGGVVKLIGSVVGQLAGWVISLFGRIGLGGVAKRFLPKIALGGMGVLGVLGLGDTFMNKVQAQENELDIQRGVEKSTAEKQSKSTDTFEKIINKFKQAVDLLLSGGKAKQDGKDDSSVVPTQQLVPGGSTGGPADFSGSESSEKAFNYFVSQGYTKEQSAAIVGNLLQENRAMDPTLKNSIDHTGIAQWDPKDRYPKMLAFAQSKGLDPNTLEAQLQFVEQELQTGSGGLSKARLQGTKSLEEATLLVRKQYLRPGEAEAMDSNRLSFAQGVLSKYGAGNTNLTSAQQVNFGNVPTGKLSPEVSVIQMGGDSGGVQAAPSSGGVSSIPAQTKGPSIAFLPSNNFDSYAGLSAKMLYNIVEA